MFRLIGSLALLLVFSLPAVAQDRPPESSIFIGWSRLFPNGVTVPLSPAPTYVIFDGHCGISYDSAGLATWGLVPGGLFLGPQNIVFNPTFFTMTYICNDKIVFKRYFIICDGPCPRSPRIHVRTKPLPGGVRG
jgi:hypothetical protein